jgi:uncharacterized membrane protein YbhN (UPF0104 family)/phosphoserine phosphatase
MTSSPGRGDAGAGGHQTDAVRQRVVQVGATLLFVIAAGAYLSRASRWDEVTETLALVSNRRMALLAALALANLASYWLVTAAVLPGLGVRRAGAVHLPANAISNVVPAGGALATGLYFAVLRRWDYEPWRVAAASLVSGLWNNLAKLATPLAALLAFTLTGRVSAGDVALAALAAVVIAGVALALRAVLRSERTAAALGHRAGRLLSAVTRRLGRGPVAGWDATAVKVHRDIVDVVRDRWPAVTTATIVSHATLFALFVNSLHAVGLGADQIGTAELLGVFAIARATTLLPLTPGSIGLLEVSLTASLTATGQDPDQVVAAVVVYRLATYVLPTLLGGVALLAWVWRAGSIWRRAPAGDHAAFPAAAGTAGEAVPAASAAADDVPLVVDLDGTLFPVTTRSLMVGRLARGSGRGWRTYSRLQRRGRHASKLHLWETVGLDVERAPVRLVVLRWLEAQRRSGRDVYLASGAPDAAVAAVRARFPVFRDGWGTTPERHLVGPAKAALLVERFGPRGFDYVGDSYEDLAVWEVARRAILCTPSIRLERQARRRAEVAKVFARAPAHQLLTAVRAVAAAARQRPLHLAHPAHVAHPAQAAHRADPVPPPPPVEPGRAEPAERAARQAARR